MKKMRFLLPMIAMVFAMASAIGSEMFVTIKQGYHLNSTGNCASPQDLVEEITPCTDDLDSGIQCRLDVSGQPLAYQAAPMSSNFCIRPIYRPAN